MNWDTIAWLPIGAFAVLSVIWLGSRRPRTVPYSSLAPFRSVRSAVLARLARHGPWGLRAASLALLAIALARPYTERPTRRSHDGLDIILVIDTSESMRALDFVWEDKRLNRLEIVKRVVTKFIRERQDDRLGLVVFGTHAFTQTPLTLDHDVLASFLQRLTIGAAGDKTALGDAIAVATKRLLAVEAKSRVMIVLTDGDNTAGSLAPETAAEAAAASDVKIYTIAVGTSEPVPFPVGDPQRPAVEYVQIPVDEEVLQHIAEKTKGAFFRASTADDLSATYAQIDQLEKRRAESLRPQERVELFRWALIPALVLLGLELIWRMTRFWPLP